MKSLRQKPGKNISKFFGNIGKSLSGAFTVVIEKISSFAGRLMERVSKISGAIGERLSYFFRQLGKGISHYYRTAVAKMSKVLGSFTIKSSVYSKKVKPVQAQQVFEQKGPKLTMASPEVIASALEKPSTFSKIMRTASKWAVVIAIPYEGYSVTKEVYQMKMAGKKVHPSRVVARASFGFAGGIAGGIALGAALAWIPVAGPIIGGLVGGFLGAILSEQSFELIMPLHAANWLWVPLDFILGGVLGSILGIIFGIPYGFRKGRKHVEPRKVIDWILLPFAPLRIADSVSSYVLKGFFRGGFIGSMLMLVVFTFFTPL